MSNTTHRKNGCHNRAPFAAMQTIGTTPCFGEYGQLITRPVQINNFSAADSSCQYIKSALGQKDEGCMGCKWRLEP